MSGGFRGAQATAVPRNAIPHTQLPCKSRSNLIFARRIAPSLHLLRPCATLPRPALRPATPERPAQWPSRAGVHHHGVRRAPAARPGGQQLRQLRLARGHPAAHQQPRAPGTHAPTRLHGARHGLQEPARICRNPAPAQPSRFRHFPRGSLGFPAAPPGLGQMNLILRAAKAHMCSNMQPCLNREMFVSPYVLAL